jgi:CubicO group peptidase (beta-lactamase class C family)
MLGLLGCGAPGSDQPAAVAGALALREADSLVAAWVETERVPGAVLLVSRGDEVVHHEAYGWARRFDYGEGQYAPVDTTGPGHGLVRLENAEPMTPEAVFDLASVSKVMATTYAVMLLVDRGALDLDAPVQTYLPDFRGPEKDRITPRHLLTHRSGLPQWVPVYYHAADSEGAYAHVRDLPLAWPVGEARHYSDLGFMLLGRIVESIAGAGLDAFLHAELYRPLGLASTGFRMDDGGQRRFAATSHGNPFEHRMVHDATFGYRIEGDPDAWAGWRTYTLRGEVNDGNAHHAFGGVAGHAGLFSTATDLQVLVQLLLNGGEIGGRRFLNPEVVSRFLTPTGEGQALGWQTPDYAPVGAFAHTGFTGTFVLGARGEGLAVVLLTNRQNGGVADDGTYPDIGPLQQAVVEALLR